MKVLLDTHVFIWSLLDSSKLTKEAIDVLTNEENEFLISPISLWEILVLAEKKRLQIKGDADEWVKEALKVSQIIEAPITAAIAIESRNVKLSHQDPADRFIVATAKLYGCALMTADKEIIKRKPCKLIALK